jgi:hypothetical protein
MSDMMVLQSTDIPLQKTYSSAKNLFVFGGQSTAYKHELIPISSIDTLADTLAGLSNEPFSAIVFGELKSEYETSFRCNREFIQSATQQWTILDIDGLPFDGDIADTDDVLRTVIDALPNEFKNTNFWFNFSSNMGFKPGISVHLGFWLSRPCTDVEMKVWLQNTVADTAIYKPTQLILTCAPHFPEGVVDPVPVRCGLHKRAENKDTVKVPSGLAEKAKVCKKSTARRVTGSNGELISLDVVVDPETGLIIDGREQHLFNISVSEMASLVRETQEPYDVVVLTDRIWDRFVKECDLTRVGTRAWTREHAEEKAKARIDDYETGRFSFKQHGKGATYLTPESSNSTPQKLVSANEAQSLLEQSLTDFFCDLESDNTPRSSIKITMGTGKTTATINKLRTYLANNLGKRIEIYLPRHELIYEWIEKLEDTYQGGIRAKVTHVKPRVSGVNLSEPDSCMRPRYVESLQRNGHSVYSNACAGESLDDECEHFKTCPYINQFRQDLTVSGNAITLYTHTALFLERNRMESEYEPDLVIIDESFYPAATSDIPTISTDLIRKYIRTSDKPRLGRYLLEALEEEPERAIEYLRELDTCSDDFYGIDLSEITPRVTFDGNSSSSRNIGSAKEHRSLRLLIESVRKELKDADRSSFSSIVYKEGKNGEQGKLILCTKKQSRIGFNTPLLYLDATADELITEQFLPNTNFQSINVKQNALVTQVYDKSGSNQYWKGTDGNYPELPKLLVLIKQWIVVGEKPLVIGAKELCDQVVALTAGDMALSQLAVAHFNSLRGSDVYKDCSVAFIVGRNQPNYEDVGINARSIFGDGEPIEVESFEQMPTATKPYVVSDRFKDGPQALAGIKTFSDPRVQACLEQTRESEILQAVARLRMVWSGYNKSVFILTNIPVDLPIDKLTTMDDIIPNKFVVELLEQGNIALTASSYVKAKGLLVSETEAVRKKYDRASISAGNLLDALPSLYQTAAWLVNYKAGDQRKTIHSHLFLPEAYQFERDAHLEYLSFSMSKPPSLDHIRNTLEAIWGIGAEIVEVLPFKPECTG